MALAFVSCSRHTHTSHTNSDHILMILSCVYWLVCMYLGCLSVYPSHTACSHSHCDKIGRYARCVRLARVCSYLSYDENTYATRLIVGSPSSKWNVTVTRIWLHGHVRRTRQLPTIHRIIERPNIFQYAICVENTKIKNYARHLANVSEKHRTFAQNSQKWSIEQSQYARMCSCACGSLYMRVYVMYMQSIAWQTNQIEHILWQPDPFRLIDGQPPCDYSIVNKNNWPFEWQSKNCSGRTNLLFIGIHVNPWWP